MLDGLVDFRREVRIIPKGLELGLLLLREDALLQVIDPDGVGTGLCARVHVGVVTEKASIRSTDALDGPTVVDKRLHDFPVRGAVGFVERLEGAVLQAPPLKVEHVGAEVGVPVLQRVLLAERARVLEVLPAPQAGDLRVEDVRASRVEIVRDDVVVQVQVIQEARVVLIVSVGDQQPLGILRALMNHPIGDDEGTRFVRTQVGVLDDLQPRVVQLAQQAVQAHHGLVVRLQHQRRPGLVVEVHDRLEQRFEIVHRICHLAPEAAHQDTHLAVLGAPTADAHDLTDQIRHPRESAFLGEARVGGGIHRRRIPRLQQPLDLLRESRGVGRQRQQEAVPVAPRLAQLLLGAAGAGHHDRHLEQHGLHGVERQRRVDRHAEVQVCDGDVLHFVASEGNELHHLLESLPLQMRLEPLHVRQLASAAGLRWRADEQQHEVVLAEHLVAHLLQRLHQQQLLLSRADGTCGRQHELLRPAAGNVPPQRLLRRLVVHDERPFLGLLAIDEAVKGVEVAEVRVGPQSAHGVCDEDDGVHARGELSQRVHLLQVGEIHAEPESIRRFVALHDLRLVQHPGHARIGLPNPWPLGHVVAPHDGVEEHEVRRLSSREVRIQHFVQADVVLSAHGPEVVAAKLQQLHGDVGGIVQSLQRAVEGG
eukprot:scaffold285_cov304-Pinguiococcus_pyrenoidosus.AAC.7